MTKPEPVSTHADLARSGLAVLAEATAYLASGTGAEEVLSSMVGALKRGLDLPECRLWIRTREGGTFRAVGAPGDVEPDEKQAAAIGRWMADRSLGKAEEDGPQVRLRLINDGESLGLLEAVLPDDPFATIGREVLDTVGKMLAPWLGSIELSEDLASEVAFRTREIDAHRRFTGKIIDSLPVGLYVIDRQYRIQAWNRKREAETQGVSREAAIGRNVFDVMRRQPRELLKLEFDRVFKTGRMEQMEIQSTTSGEQRHYRISKIPMRLHDDDVTHVITIGEDITEWKAVQQQIAQAEKIGAIGQLAAGVMHEINNPLATIGACIEALTLRVPDLPQDARQGVEEYLHIIEAELQRCESIVNGLLDFSRPKGRIKKPVQLNQIVEDALFLVKHHDRFRGLTLNRHLSEGLPSIEANAEQLIQVFLALMLNALDSMEKGGTLTVTTGINPQRTDGVMVAFSDTGIGIGQADLAKIFEPFFTTKEPGRGTGLGLSICYGIVLEHGGRIQVDSTPGRGSTFRVILPASAQKTESP